MIESDLELVEKQATAKAWLAKIENQGILEFAAGGDSLLCDKGLNFGLGDFSIMWISRGDMSTESRVISTHNSGYHVWSFAMHPTNGFWTIYYTGSVNSYLIQPIVDLIPDDIYIFALSNDRDGYTSLYSCNLSEPSQVWGYNGRVDDSVQYYRDIGSGAASGNPAAVNENLKELKDFWMLPPVNKAITEDEFLAYVSGLGSPNSLPEDLSGVGSLDEVLTDPENLVTDWTVHNVSITGGQSDSFGGTAANKITASGVSSAQRIYQSATVGGYGEITAIVKTDDGLPFVCFRFSGNETNELCVFFDFAGNFSGTDLNMPDVIKTTSSDLGGGWHKVSILYKAPANTAKTFYVYLTGTDTQSNSNLTTLAYAGTSSLLEHALSIKRIGQIFDCRPHRDGIHTDDTGNGYNWTNVGSPVIKPFSAGIR